MHHSVTLVLQKPGTVGTKPSALENLEMPHPGMSYNPVFEDHQVRPGVGSAGDSILMLSWAPGPGEDSCGGGGG